MISPELKEIFDEAVREAIDQIPAVSMGFKGSGLDLKDHVDNEMDFYLGVTIATIQERYMCKVLDKRKFTKEDVISAIPYATTSIFTMIPDLKKEIKSKIGL